MKKHIAFNILPEVEHLFIQNYISTNNERLKSGVKILKKPEFFELQQKLWSEILNDNKINNWE